MLGYKFSFVVVYFVKYHKDVNLLGVRWAGIVLLIHVSPGHEYNLLICTVMRCEYSVMINYFVILLSVFQIPNSEYQCQLDSGL